MAGGAAGWPERNRRGTGGRGDAVSLSKGSGAEGTVWPGSGGGRSAVSLRGCWGASFVGKKRDTSLPALILRWAWAAAVARGGVEGGRERDRPLGEGFCAPGTAPVWHGLSGRSASYRRRRSGERRREGAGSPGRCPRCGLRKLSGEGRGRGRGRSAAGAEANTYSCCSSAEGQALREVVRMKRSCDSTCGEGGGGGVCARGGARASTVGGDRWRGRRARYLVIGSRGGEGAAAGPRWRRMEGGGWGGPAVFRTPTLAGFSLAFGFALSTVTNWSGYPAFGAAVRGCHLSRPAVT